MRKARTVLWLWAIFVVSMLGGIVAFAPSQEVSADPVEAVHAPMSPTVTCGGSTYTVKSCYDYGNVWYTVWMNGELKEHNAKCQLQFCGPFPPCQYWALPRSPSPHTKDQFSSGQKRLYCGTDAAHVAAYWVKP